MFDRIKRLIEVRRIKREMKNGGHILLFELYLSEIFNRNGQVDSILLGKLHDSEFDLGHSFQENGCEISENNLPNIEKSDGNIYSDIEQLIRQHIIEPVYSYSCNDYKISDNPLSELLNEVEAEGSNSSPNNLQSLAKRLRDTTSISELNALLPAQYFKYIRQWNKQHNRWKEMEPTDTGTLSFIDHIMGDVNTVHIKRILSRKCSLTVTRTIVSPFTWRIDFSGQWPKLF